ncbi:MAG TPA: type II toxin-antitoxin system RatA family toxin [Bosea sp. (in: a-proteobacteria)]|jgi:coenzyme Q-binding protein COQ10|uniref:type II toxin-antitoxin system RatA family toxin n=1 Tax=Bosea sp. (in: a-proteobacteria) TaxID=1871050 RepID=UPI002E13F08A|nr:type II toxin-antitoxin system RatA family toxin [Bosea sp. (in: a-proteobacteria)]
MPMFNNTRRVKHTPEQMFALVADVEKYPQFLPLCEGLKVRRRTPREGGGEVLLADMTVGYKAIRETFTSRVTLDPGNLKVLVEYVDGPFRYLENRWTFKPDPKGCEIGFFISYEFASRMLGLLMGAMFDKAFHKFAEAFERRADLVYGRDATKASVTAP